MEKYSLNYDTLHETFNKKSYLLSEVKDKITKVAFDVVKFTDADGIDKLWQVQSSNGEEYIVAMYEDQVKTASDIKSPWSAVATKSGCVQVYLNSTPITKLAMNDLHLDKSDAPTVAETLPNRLATDEVFRQTFLSALTESEQHVVRTQLSMSGS